MSQFVKSFIKTNHVAVFSKSYCPYCVKVKSLFSNLNVKYAAIEVDHHPQSEEISQALKEMTGQRTFPNVFIKEKHIGGCDATHELHEKGQLKKLLEGLEAK
eukprot:TRINITY_DN4256_c0_g1_i1.p2 TRINITY_DN4256_c0_g1~~TRINITY_DN4256_c0_g1_i1.p2  ORF type:complete len:102 (-),score=31.76 TRINITY_DN4256_c0_g1_i1:185-490(-)